MSLSIILKARIKSNKVDVQKAALSGKKIIAKIIHMPGLQYGDVSH